MAPDLDLGPNQGLIGQPGSRRRLTTPALVLDVDLLERNLATLADQARGDGLHLRPHAKTHKCVEIARLQIGAGALGVCAATLREAEVLVAGGLAGVLITSPVVGQAKIARLAQLNRRADGLMVVLDDLVNLVDLVDAAARAGKKLDVLVDVDVGMGRTGVHSAQKVIDLARAADRAEVLGYKGIQGYSGSVQHIAAFAQRTAAYGRQLDHLSAVVDGLRAQDLAPEIVTGGGTGTYFIDRQRNLFSEHQAGSYIFMDVQYNAVQLTEGELTEGGGAPFATALFVHCSVISNKAVGLVTTDGGLKCFATDGPVPEIVGGAPEGAVYRFFGDEFGRVDFAASGQTLALGAVVVLATPHCDPTVNLHDYYHCVRGEELIDIWPIAGRGVL